MSILDGMPTTDAEVKDLLAANASVVLQVLKTTEFSPRGRSVLDALNEGLSLGDILKISKPERDALLVHGAQQMQAGDHAGAQKTLTLLHQIDPLDARAIYVLATSYQSQERYDVAGKLYVSVLALDATNPNGYLRLGECFMANREYERARACFEVGKNEAMSGVPRPDLVAHADAMLAVVEAGLAKAA